ncbi:MAG: hypothetical protein K9I34_00150 [Bacteroidales bacterium]|nr:hypothetical protein [Bacteroidales bacterium]
MFGLIWIVLFLVAVALIVFVFRKWKQKAFDFQTLLALLDYRIFPGGVEQKKEGARKIKSILKNKITLNEAEELFIHKISLFYFEKYDSKNEELIHFLRSYKSPSVNFFESIELHDYFVKEHQRCQKETWHEAFACFEVQHSRSVRQRDFIFQECNSEFLKLFELENTNLNGKSLFQASTDLGTRLSDYLQDLTVKRQSIKFDQFDTNLKKQMTVVAYSSVKGKVVTFISESGHQETKVSAKIA